jgi:hypothetical protein
VPVTLHGCLACGAPLELGADRRYIVGAGKTTIEGGVVRAAQLTQFVQPQTTEEATAAWREAGGKRLRADFVFRIPAQVPAWTQGGARGFSVDIIGYRVYDPCDGKILIAKPASAPLRADKNQCKGEPPAPATAPATGPATKPVDTGPKLPDQLSSYQIKQSMQPAVAEVNGCFATYGVPGRADVNITVGGDGVVRKVDLKGDFADTPTGECIVKAIEKVEFPKFKRQEMLVPWPFILR